MNKSAVSPRSLSGHVAMLAFATLVAGSFALGRQIADKIDPLALTALRFFIAAIVLCAIAGTLGRFERLHARGLWRYGLLGICMAVYFFTMFQGLKSATAVSMSATFTLTPLISAFFGWLLLRQIPSVRVALGLMIGAIGALWVIFDADFGAFLAFRIGHGEAIFIIGCIGHALYAPLVPFLNKGEPLVVFTAGMLVAGTVILAVIGAPKIAATNWSNLSPYVWAVIAYLALLTTAATFFLVQFAAMRLPAAKVMAYTYLVPSMVILWNVVMFAVLPPVALLGGVALTILALLALLRD